MSEYTLACHGPPDPMMPWPMFLLVVSRANAVFARRLLATMHGVAWAIGKAFGGKQTGPLDVMRQEIERAAFPRQAKATTSDALEQEAFALMQSDPEPTEAP